MATSELNFVIGKLRRGSRLDPPQIDEIERTLLILRDNGWSGFVPADEALLALIPRRRVPRK